MGVVTIRGGEHPAEPEECVIIGFSGLCSRLVPGPLFAPPPGGERSNARGLCAPEASPSLLSASDIRSEVLVSFGDTSPLPSRILPFSSFTLVFISSVCTCNSSLVVLSTNPEAKGTASEPDNLRGRPLFLLGPK